MNLLAIDTSTDLATVALSVGEEIISEEQDSMRQHAQLLLPMIERLLAVAGVNLNQLDAIIFGRGPGSFTGLRIACSIAKALAYAHDLPLYPVSSLAAIAYEAYQTEIDHANEFTVLALLDARMHQVYWANYSANEFTTDEQVTDPTDITLVGAKPIIVAGVNFTPYVTQFPESLKPRIIKQCVVYPNAKAMIQLVKAGHCKVVSTADAQPVYVRNQVTQGESRG